jgi:hypothetical protein
MTSSHLSHRIHIDALDDGVQDRAPPVEAEILPHHTEVSRSLCSPVLVGLESGKLLSDVVHALLDLRSVPTSSRFGYQFLCHLVFQPFQQALISH